MTRSAREGFRFDYADREFLDLFWRRITSEGEYPRKELAEVVSAAFLGVQMECAGCHKHPYDRWTQADYNGFINVFARATYGSSTELNRAILRRMQRRREAIVEAKSSKPFWSHVGPIGKTTWGSGEATTQPCPRPELVSKRDRDERLCG